MKYDANSFVYMGQTYRTGGREVEDILFQVTTSTKGNNLRYNLRIGNCILPDSWKTEHARVNVAIDVINGVLAIIKDDNEGKYRITKSTPTCLHRKINLNYEYIERYLSIPKNEVLKDYVLIDNMLLIDVNKYIKY